MSGVVLEGIDTPASDAALQAWEDAAEHGSLIRSGVHLGSLTTYKFGGAAAYFAEITSDGELSEVIEVLLAAPLPVLVLGRGSNLVVSDDGFPGLVLHLAGDFVRIDIEGDGTVVAGGATPLPRLARATTKAARSGLEFFVGIPGSVGGAVCMNAGCLGSETADWLIDATIVDLSTGASRTNDPKEIELAYRHSSLTPADLVTKARFRTKPGTVAAGELKLREITAWRKRTQPGGTYNAGSVFKNPPGDAAGRIIDSLDLKGFRSGGVAVSEKHANFFVADETASAQDVYNLVHGVRASVLAATGIALEPEVRFAGPFTAVPPPAPVATMGEIS